MVLVICIKKEKVAQAVAQEYTAIRHAVDKLVRVNKRAVLESLGVTEACDSEEDTLAGDCDSDDVSNDS